ncbi:methyltransferase domain-containing protein [Nocardia sp. NBC_01499]|uniref:methyltransferase n=1 Tax=Nocardia sp. NBC_01499 TaxID=2903597 RepID=UPI00386F5EE3
MGGTSDTHRLVDPYEVAALYYDLTVSHPIGNTTPQPSFFASLADVRQRVLEIGAGTGRTTLAVAERARSVWCLEPSPAMRSLLLNRVQHSALPPDRVTILPFRELPETLPGRFDYAVLAGVLGSVAHDDRPRLFRTIAGHLTHGAILASDMFGDTDFSPASPVLIAEARLGEIRYTTHVEVTDAVSGPEGGIAETKYVYRTYLGSQLLTEEEQVQVRHGTTRSIVIEQLNEAGFTVLAPGQRAGSVVAPLDVLLAERN